eukprot:TRINITY_DN8704_c1_g1_i1.p1 TRINITY_DN8704_c1_g1~~TRINITY_DN8704_c1_g1_i1.p1  ORF type:complete len:773 (+),score=125.97 TRINITY_DN8704_c1_g1_i1:25-2343(+)
MASKCFQRFLRTATCHPDRVFIETTREAWTYAKVAEEVLNKKIEDGIIICCKGDVTPVDVVWMLRAVAGGGWYYVLNESETPEGNLATIFNQLGAKKILRNGTIQETDICPTTPGSLGSFLYVVSTSGTTGKPKLVKTSAACIDAYVPCRISTEGISENSRIFVASSCTFDPSQGDLYTAMHAGCTLVLPRFSDILTDFTGLLRQTKPTHVTTTPVVWAAVPGELSHEFSSFLQCVSLGGEPIPQSMIEAWTRSDKTACLGLYGVTECTVYQAYVRYPRGRPVKRNLIGQPYEGVTFSVDEETSELSIHGEVVANEAKTWKTGDVVEKDSSGGGYVFVGRIEGDRQIKIRGRRVDLRELENTVLDKFKGVNMCRAVWDATNSKLALHCTPECPLVGRIAKTVAETNLPGYLHPHSVATHDTFPSTRNGKIDDSRLLTTPSPQTTDESSCKATPLQTIIIAAWKKELGSNSPITPNSDWYASGGDSFKGLRLTKHLRDTLHLYQPDGNNHGEVSGAFDVWEMLKRPLLSDYAAFLASKEVGTALGFETETDIPSSPMTSPCQDLLVESVQAGFLDGVEALIVSCGAGVCGGYGRDIKGLSPLHYAARNGDLNMVKKLVELGGKVFGTTELGVTPVHEAAAAGHTHIVEHFIHNERFPLQAKDGNRQTIFHHAARSGHTDTILSLSKTGKPTPLNHYDRWGRSPLHWAVLNNHITTVEALLQLGLPVNETRTLARRTRLDMEYPLDIAFRKHPEATALHDLLRNHNAVRYVEKR